MKKTPKIIILLILLVFAIPCATMSVKTGHIPKGMDKIFKDVPIGACVVNVKPLHLYPIVNFKKIPHIKYAVYPPPPNKSEWSSEAINRSLILSYTTYYTDKKSPLRILPIGTKFDYMGFKEIEESDFIFDMEDDLSFIELKAKDGTFLMMPYYYYKQRSGTGGISSYQINIESMISTCE